MKAINIHLAADIVNFVIGLPLSVQCVVATSHGMMIPLYHTVHIGWDGQVGLPDTQYTSHGTNKWNSQNPGFNKEPLQSLASNYS